MIWEGFTNNKNNKPIPDDLENQKYNESKKKIFELLVRNLVVNVSENRVMSPSLYHKIKLNNDIEKFE